MKNLLTSTVALMLAACSSAPAGRHRLFIDSNVTADVYTGDVKVGTTPYWGELSGNDVRHLTVRRRGYKTAAVKADYKMKDGVMMGGVFAVSSSLVSQCDKKAGSIFNDKEETESVCNLSAVYTVGTAAYGIGVTALLTDSFAAPSYVMEYSDNEYYVEMIPDGKVAYSENDLRNYRIKSFVLKNYAAIQSGSGEHAAALTALLNRPAPTATGYVRPFEYLRSIGL